MMRKTTIYIEENELNTLKALSITQNKSVTDLISLGVKQVCQSVSKEEKKIMEMLNKIRENTKKRGYSGKEVMQLAVKAQREVRHELKKRKSKTAPA